MANMRRTKKRGGGKSKGTATHHSNKSASNRVPVNSKPSMQPKPWPPGALNAYLANNNATRRAKSKAYNKTLINKGLSRKY